MAVKIRSLGRNNIQHFHLWSAGVGPRVPPSPASDEIWGGQTCLRYKGWETAWFSIPSTYPVASQWQSCCWKLSAGRRCRDGIQTVFENYVETAFRACLHSESRTWENRTDLKYPALTTCAPVMIQSPSTKCSHRTCYPSTHRTEWLVQSRERKGAPSFF